MTVDEIFSSESEHLYFRLVAARNALNAADDPDTVQVLNEILDETLNNLSRLGTEEEIAAAEGIVVRKSNKTVKEYLSCKKFSLIATAVMVAAAVIAVLALLIVILGSNSDSKIKPIVTIVIVAGFIIAASIFVSNYMKKKMAVARDALKGKTVIGCRIEGENTSVSKPSSKRESSGAVKTKGPKVVRNYFGIVKVVLILGIIGGLAFFGYTKRNEIVDFTKETMFKIGLYDYAEKYENNRWKEINNKLVTVKNGVYYNKAVSLLTEKNYTEAISLFEKCLGYQDADSKLTESRNWDYFTQAEKDVTTDMLRARNDLKKITLPFEKNVEALIKEYNKHIDYIAVYGNGVERFNLQNFSKKNGSLYIFEERLGWKKVEKTVDREGYAYKVIEKNSEEDFIYWYIASDNVLKVTPEGETIIKK